MKTIEPAGGTILPAAELEVMNGVWLATMKHERPVTTREIIACAPGLERLRMTTVFTFLFRLQAKGFLRMEKMPETRTNLYVPQVSYEAYKETALSDFLEHIMRGDRVELARLIFESMSEEELSRARKRLASDQRG